jgi:uncharacterized protein YbbC (DUF1343 family)
MPARCGRKSRCGSSAPNTAFFGRGGAGENIADASHQDWKIPIFSLYRRNARALAAMLDLVDAFVFDVPDDRLPRLTYVSTCSS